MEDKITPIVEGEILELSCISIGKKGDGIFKKEGFVIIVPEAKIDETYSIRVNKVLPKIAFGEIVEG